MEGGVHMLLLCLACSCSFTCSFDCLRRCCWRGRGRTCLYKPASLTSGFVRAAKAGCPMVHKVITVKRGVMIESVSHTVAARAAIMEPGKA